MRRRPLCPADPADDLQASLNASRRWIERHRPDLAGVPTVLDRLIDRYANQIRAVQPCLIHGDANFENFIVTSDAVRPIDWDSPEVDHPFLELANLDQQAYLNGSADGLPPAFWIGYGTRYDQEILLLFRAIRCLSRLASTDWAEWEADAAVSGGMKAELRRRHDLLERWAMSLPDRLRHAPSTCGA